MLSLRLLTLGVDNADDGHVLGKLGQRIGLVDRVEELGHVLPAVLEQDADTAGLVSATAYSLCAVLAHPGALSVLPFTCSTRALPDS